MKSIASPSFATIGVYGEKPQETVQVNFTLADGEGRLDASVVVPAGKVTLTQILPAIQGLTTNIVDSVVQIVQLAGRQVSCKAGCGACCRQMVPLSIFEAEALAEWVATLPEERQDELRQRFHITLLALKKIGLLDRMDPAEWVDGSADAKTLAIDHLAVTCPRNCSFVDVLSRGLYHPGIVESWNCLTSSRYERERVVKERQDSLTGQ